MENFNYWRIGEGRKDGENDVKGNEPNDTCTL
jgi:hypothetical protein